MAKQGNELKYGNRWQRRDIGGEARRWEFKYGDRWRSKEMGVQVWR
jgi:hypothetical protein